MTVPSLIGLSWDLTTCKLTEIFLFSEEYATVVFIIDDKRGYVLF